MESLTPAVYSIGLGLVCAVPVCVTVAIMLAWDGRRELRTWRTLGQVALFGWFAFWTWQVNKGVLFELPYHLDTLGIDGRLYYRAAETWLSGGDPWTAYTITNTWPASGGYIHFLFTGPPPTVLVFAPFTILPEEVFVVGWFVVTVAAGIYTLRRLSLPIWWLAFPPLAQGILVANPHVVALALLLSSSTLLRALAAPVKAYAAIPLIAERRWRAFAIMAALVGLSALPFLGLWTLYAHDYGQIQSWLMNATHGGFSAARDPRLFAFVAVILAALALIDRRAAGWLAVPALWPAAQYFYASFLLPLRSVWLAVIVAAAWGPSLVWGGSPRLAAIVPWAVAAYGVTRLARATPSLFRPTGGWFSGRAHRKWIHTPWAAPSV